jgi:hypothetical protein
MVEPIEAKIITDLPTMAKLNTDQSIVVEQKLKMAVRRGDIIDIGGIDRRLLFWRLETRRDQN